MAQGANREFVRVGLLLLLVLLLVPGPAHARSRRKRTKVVKPKVVVPVAPPAEPDVSFVVAPIVGTGTPRFDEVFASASPMVAALDTNRTQLTSARSALKAALGLDDGELTSKAMSTLKAAAGDALQVDTSGLAPRLSASSPLPDNLRAAVDALNTLLAAAAAATVENPTLAAEARRITTAAATFPDEAAAMVKTDARTAALTLAAVNNNTRTVASLPQQADVLARLGARLLSDAHQVFDAKK